MPAKFCTAKRPSFCSTLNASYYNSFIKLLILIIHKIPCINQMMCWLFTVFFTSILLSCSVAHYIAVCILSACLSWLPRVWTKIDRIYKWEFSDVSKETSPILDSHSSTSNILNRQKKTFDCSSKKWVRKRKRKKVLWSVCYQSNSRTCKFFETICILIMLIQLKHFLNYF